MKRSRVLAIYAAMLGTVLPSAAARAQEVAYPVFVEDFAGAGYQHVIGQWTVSGRLDPAQRSLRIGTVFDSDLNRQVGRFTVQLGDATSELPDPDLYICGHDGSRILELERDPNAVVPSERVEVEVRRNRETGAGELVRFDETVWYRFSFKVPVDWPRDQPTGGRPACRTVIHQIKQDAFKDGQTCSASPFFKIEARPWGDHVRFFAQIMYGAPCAIPVDVHRVQICVVELPRGTWNAVNVRLLPSHRQGRADVWLNGQHCGTYEGPMADPSHGAMRDQKPFINVQPRFGLYRDRRPEAQTIYFDRIMYWNREPGSHPDWGVR